MPILDVLFIDQWDAGATRFVNDCGVACVAMLLEWYGKRNGWTVDQLSAQTGLINSDSGLYPAQLAALLIRRGLPATAHAMTLDDIRQKIIARAPVIVLIQYAAILGRLDTFGGGHFVTVVGFDDSHFVLNDPDYAGGYAQRGHDYRCPVAELDKAMAVYGNQGVYVEVSQMSLADQIKALAEQNRANLAQIETLAAQIDTIPIPPAVEKQTLTVVAAGGLSIRGSASVNGVKLGGLKAGTLVEVGKNAIVDGAYQWVQLFGVDGAAYASTAFICKQNGSEVYLGPKA